MSARMKMNVLLLTKARIYVPMADVSTGILDTSVFVIQDTSLPRIKKVAWMLDRVIAIDNSN